MTQQPISMLGLAEDVRDLRMAVAGLTAIIAALPETATIDAERVREILPSLIDPKADVVENDQIARAMHFAQITLKLGRQA